MKTILAVLLVVLCATNSALADGAFGAYKGMTKEDLEEKDIVLQKVSNKPPVSYISPNAPVKNDYFPIYQYTFNQKNQLCEIAGWSRSIKVDDYGSELKKEMNIIKQVLDTKYGEAKVFDNLKNYPPEKFMFYFKQIQHSRKIPYIFSWNSRDIALLPWLTDSDGLTLMLSYRLDNCR